MHLDRLDRDEERLRDLLVGHPVGRQLSHALARSWSVRQARSGGPFVAGTGGGDLVVRPPGEPEGAARCARSTPSRSRSRALGPLVGAPERGAEVDKGARVLEPRFGAREHLDRLPEQPDSALPSISRRARAGRRRWSAGHPSVERARSSAASTRASSCRSRRRSPSAAQLRHGAVPGLSNGSSRTVSPTWRSSTRRPARGWSRCAHGRGGAETRRGGPGRAVAALGSHLGR